MYNTFAEAKASTLRNVAGYCAGSPEYMALLNESIELLMDEDWADLVVPIHVCVRNGCVVWNRYVGSVRKLNICNNHLPINSIFGDFISRDQYQSSCGCEFNMTAIGKTPTYSDPWGQARYLRAYPRDSSDVGKAITFFGRDNGNQPLRTRNADGTWSEGLILQLIEPYAQTTTFVSPPIDRVLLDDMNDQVLLYGFDSVNSVLEDLAVYEPHETNPEYVKYRLNVPCGTQSVNALVKLRFIPVRHDTDLVMVPLRALKQMMISLKRGEDGDFVGKKTYEMEAYAVMNRRQRSETPDDQIVINHGLSFYTGQHVH